MCIELPGAKPANTRALLGRRGFLKAGAAAALLGAGAAVSPPMAAAAPLGAAGGKGGKRRVPADAISIQLYTLREMMDADLDAVFAGLSALGYRKVEQAGLHGRTAPEFKAALDAHGLHATSGHQSIYPYDASRWRESIETAVILGQGYMVEPAPAFVLSSIFTGIAPPALVWSDFAEQLNKAAAQASHYGIKVGYHNHNPEFMPLPDDPSRTGYDILLAETDPDLVHFELDLYWSWAGGKDPVELLREHPTRFRQFHVKDMDANGDITAPGTGIIDFARIFKAAAELGIAEYTIEQDNAGQDAMESARLGYELLRTIRW